ncbi:nuclear transport factor 2 family protein [Mycolicibacterium hodleri]|uniref:Nuclear transport factor 2 family protein n=1 Tax=Mycolicibacterium hodleri TaxID=49897 RepID=A0A502EH04_9MYCO|nr:nuclear transport factor 2 family protein [Mycolicibacterium hodleri]TPG36747.1 nuclear transport factor 2 family protein [Mycolicibacterium hodleri]
MTSSVRTAREVVEAYNLELWNARRFELADELIADTMIRHDVGESHTLTRAEALKRVTDTWAEMDSLRFDLNIVIDGGDGEHVAMVWDSTMAKDDNEVKVASIEVFRVVNGQIVEVWNCGYKLGAWS